MPIIRNCILPEDLYYDVENDLWARFEASGLVTLGLTDVGQSPAVHATEQRWGTSPLRPKR